MARHSFPGPLISPLPCSAVSVALSLRQMNRTPHTGHLNADRPIAARARQVRHSGHVVCRCSPRGAQADAPGLFSLWFDGGPAGRAQARCAEVALAVRREALAQHRRGGLHNGVPEMQATSGRSDSAAAQPFPVCAPRSRPAVPRVRPACRLRPARRRTSGLRLAARCRVVNAARLNRPVPWHIQPPAGSAGENPAYRK